MPSRVLTTATFPSPLAWTIASFDELSKVANRRWPCSTRYPSPYRAIKTSGSIFFPFTIIHRRQRHGIGQNTCRKIQRFANGAVNLVTASNRLVADRATRRLVCLAQRPKLLRIVAHARLPPRHEQSILGRHFKYLNGDHAWYIFNPHVGFEMTRSRCCARLPARQPNKGSRRDGPDPYWRNEGNATRLSDCRRGRDDCRRNSVRHGFASIRDLPLSQISYPCRQSRSARENLALIELTREIGVSSDVSSPRLFATFAQVQSGGIREWEWRHWLGAFGS